MIDDLSESSETRMHIASAGVSLSLPEQNA